jgi:hypothetical protein
MNFSAPESARTQPLHNAETLSFIGTWEALQSASDRTTGWHLTKESLKLIVGGIEDEAQTIFLNELATW